MAEKYKISPAMRKTLDTIKRRIDKAEEVRKNGGNMYQQLEARLTDEKTGKLIQDIVITAIIHVDNLKDAKSFYQGYAKNIKNNPKKYPKKVRKKPYQYAATDINLALHMHFTEPKTYRLWEKALPKKNIKSISDFMD